MSKLVVDYSSDSGSGSDLPITPKRRKIIIRAPEPLENDEFQPKRAKQSLKATNLASILPAPKGRNLPVGMNTKANSSFFNLDPLMDDKPTLSSSIKNVTAESPQVSILSNDIYDPKNYETAMAQFSAEKGSINNIEYNDDTQLNNEATSQLIGRKRNKKKDDDDVVIVDVTAVDQQKLQQQLLLSTSVKMQPGTSVAIRPTRRQRNRHNIKSLAFQSQTMDQQLQDPWAEAKRSRQETRAKYGW